MEDLLNFNSNYNKDYIPKNLKVIDENLNAFQSGVGYGYDCEISKMVTENKNITAPITFTLEGYGKESIKYLSKVAFDYRFKIEADYKERIRDGSLKVKIEAYRYNHSRFRLYRYAIKPMQVRYKITCKVSYISPSGSNYKKTVNRELTFNGVYDLSNTPKLNYTPKGYVSIEPINQKLDDRTIGAIMEQTGRKLYKDLDEAHKSVNSNLIQYYDYRIYDDYKTDVDETYNPNQGFDLGADGTFRITTGDDNKVERGDYLYAKGVADAQIYSYEAFTEEEAITSAELDPFVIFGGEHMTAPLVCLRNSNLRFDGSSDEIVTHVEIVEDTPIKLTNDYYVSDELTYTFSNKVPNAIIKFADVISSNEPDGKYRIYINILECTEHIYYQGHTKCEPGARYTLVTMLNDSIAFEGRSYMTDKIYEEYYPAKSKEPLSGVVNGAIDGNIKIHKGKNDFVVKAYRFALDNKMYNHRITVETNVLTPSGATINAQFVSSGRSDTNIDGDVLKVTSSYSTMKEIDTKGILTTRTINVKTGDIKDEYITILTVDKDYAYTFNKYKLNVYSESGDIAILDQTKDSDLKIIDDKCKVYAKIESLQRATSRWNPLIHNGYYYINQHEFFLYSNRKPIANYIQQELIKLKEISYDIRLTLSNSNVIHQTFQSEILADEKEHCIVEDINSLLSSWMEGIGYIISDIKNISITKVDEDFELIYDEEALKLMDCKIYAKTNVTLKYSVDTDKIPVIIGSEGTIIPYVNINRDKKVRTVKNSVIVKIKE
ncbi:hypothetical protein U729_3139 (plasmid) [Clostridium baratii str. Sullivan]|uniref:Uncharacterized protein n=1 Tax=Clostridium baratii str. Sullivan TaxID=1415775 RepID=A0A0A7G0J0_9CLOT|nr:hypothetical protein [Clostridium baratii]AIY85358.1 hypothetical protein U729_3139 [Clostridium baratii str. Sullivan]